MIIRMNEKTTKKQKLTLSIDPTVIQKAKDVGINISEITEGILRGFSFTPSDLETQALLDKYFELFEVMQPILKKYSATVKVGEIENYNDDVFEGTSDLFLGADGEFFIPDYRDSYAHPHPEEIDPNELSDPNTILKNFINSLATSAENRKKQITELEMAKRIIEAIADTSLKRTLTLSKSKQQRKRKQKGK